jgi:hypothetical protein
VEAPIVTGKLVNPLLFVRILLILMVVVIIYLVAGFVRQVGISQQRKAELRQIEHNIAAAEEESAQLDQRLLYANSDEAVMHWALENGWGKPNEVLVVLVEPADVVAASAADTTGVESATADSPTDSWWDLFFGQR